MDLQRNREASRATLLGRLAERGAKWTTAQAILGDFSFQGPWSEDLEDLVRERLAECQDAVDQMHMRSFVRLRQESSHA